MICGHVDFVLFEMGPTCFLLPFKCNPFLSNNNYCKTFGDSVCKYNDLNFYPFFFAFVVLMNVKLPKNDLNRTQQ